MNCEEFRRAVGAEPTTMQLEVLEHAASCVECTRYRGEMRAMDGLIHKALAIDLSKPAARAQARPSMATWRIAASALVTLAVLAVGWIAYPRQSLAEDVVRHVVIESLMIKDSNPAPSAEEIQAVLQRAGVRLAPNDLNVSFAKTCGFRGQLVPHLIVRTQSGPVTVMLITNAERIEKARRFKEQGFNGTFVPAPRGVLAVLGRTSSVEQVTDDVLAALSWDTTAPQ
jgi:hypothetical protein